MNGAKSGNSAFVAMWFDAEVNEIYDIQIKLALEECGYEGKFRVDREEHTNKIDDQIIAKINEASLIVVDLTCPLIPHNSKVVPAYRGGVYFEAGYAMGRGTPIIWTCRKDNVDHIHFDLRQYNQIVWYKDGSNYFVGDGDDRISFQQALQNRIGALNLNRKINPN